MSVTHSTTARNAATDAVTTLIGTSGNLVFRITGSTVASPSAAVATLPLSATAFASSSSGTATANSISGDTNAAGNVSPIAFATLQTSAAVIVIQCAVAATGSDINMTGGLTVASGDTVTCSSLTYTALSA